jgi:microcystin-dependent protein
MSEPFIGEVKIVSFNFPPRGWALCNGQLLPINQNQALFSILGTTYGGNGQTTFALPDLRGRTPTYVGQGLVLGERGGEENHTLSASEAPQHTHIVQASSATAAANVSPAGMVLAVASGQLYGPLTSPAALNSTSITSFGGSQPHANMQPYLVLNFIIALQGIFPSRS